MLAHHDTLRVDRPDLRRTRPRGRWDQADAPGFCRDRTGAEQQGKERQGEDSFQRGFHHEPILAPRRPFRHGTKVPGPGPERGGTIRLWLEDDDPTGAGRAVRAGPGRDPGIASTKDGPTAAPARRRSPSLLPPNTGEIGGVGGGRSSGPAIQDSRTDPAPHPETLTKWTYRAIYRVDDPPLRRARRAVECGGERDGGWVRGGGETGRWRGPASESPDPGGGPGFLYERLF